MTDYQLHIVVRGRVQGVFFRAFTRENALARGLTGWARNQADGSVDILLSGPRQQVLEVQQLLREGPPGAEVSDMTCEEVNRDAPSQFVTG